MLFSGYVRRRHSGKLCLHFLKHTARLCYSHQVIVTLIFSHELALPNGSAKTLSPNVLGRNNEQFNSEGVDVL